MLYLSVWMTLLVVISLFLMMMVVRMIAGKSSRYFIQQQESIGDVNGYIEEMINGQKVIKVFCHEQKAKEAFDVKNDNFANNTTTANKYANVLNAGYE